MSCRTAALEGFGLTAAEALAAGTPSMCDAGGRAASLRSCWTLRRNSSSPPAPRSDLADGLIAALTGRDALPGSAACRAYAEARFAIRPGRPAARRRSIGSCWPVNRRISRQPYRWSWVGAELTLLPTAHSYRGCCTVWLLKDWPLFLRPDGLPKSASPSCCCRRAGMLGVTRQGGALRTLASAAGRPGNVWRLARLARVSTSSRHSQKAADRRTAAGRLTAKPVVLVSPRHHGRAAFRRRSAQGP